MATKSFSLKSKKASTPPPTPKAAQSEIPYSTKTEHSPRDFSTKELEGAFTLLSGITGGDTFLAALAKQEGGISSLIPFLEKFVEVDGDLTAILGKTHEPVSLDEFIDSDEFLDMTKSVWPVVRETIHQVVDGGYVEAILTGSIGIGKTTLAQVVNAYNLYLLSLYRSPQLNYDLMPTSRIVFAMLNKTATLASRVTYGEFRSMLDRCPYFKTYFRYDRKVRSMMSFESNISVISGYAGATNILGMNVMGGIIDEINFMANVEKSARTHDGGHFNQAESAYSAMVRRRKSRFSNMGKLPGCVCIVSSKGHPKDFTETRIREVETEVDNTSFVWNRAHWEVVPDRYSGVTFPLFIGDNKSNPRILHSDKDMTDASKIIHVPEELRSDFVRDMDGSLRDYAGVSTLTDDAYIWDRSAIWNCATLFDKAGYHSPYDIIEADLSEGLPPINSDYVLDNPDKFRVVHVDLGLTGDACGIACGYVSRLITTRRMNQITGMAYLDEMPEIVLDFAMRVIPPVRGEIDFELVRQVIYNARDVAGIPIKVVTFDGFQSVDSRQILKKRGFRTGYQSVELIESYRPMKDAIFQGRFLCPEHEVMFEELASVRKTEDMRHIDHPPTGSKDVADAATGVVNVLLSLRNSWLQNDLLGKDADKTRFGANTQADARNIARENAYVPPQSRVLLREQEKQAKYNHANGLPYEPPQFSSKHMVSQHDRIGNIRTRSVNASRRSRNNGA